MEERRHKHKGAEKIHPVKRVHKSKTTMKWHDREIQEFSPVKVPGTKKRAKKALKPRTTVVKGSPERDYGRAPRGTPTYEPIPGDQFDPRNPPEDFIIVKMNHALLDEMLQAMSRKKAQAVGVPCRRV